MLVGGQGGGHLRRGVLRLGMGTRPGGAWTPERLGSSSRAGGRQDIPMLPDLLYSLINSLLRRPQPPLTLLHSLTIIDRQSEHSVPRQTWLPIMGGHG